MSGCTRVVILRLWTELGRLGLGAWALFVGDSTRLYSTSDPYCNVMLNHKKLMATPIIGKNLNPKWEDHLSSDPTRNDRASKVKQHACVSKVCVV